MRSTGGEHEVDLSDTLASFEGLVFTTARMFASQVRREEDDLAQELRVRVWRAVTSYDPAKSASLERYVFSALTNKVKDFKRDAAREMKRREAYGITFLHIEDTFVSADSVATPAERFDQLHHHATHEQVYADVENEPFDLPGGVTDDERNVLALLVFGSTRNEIAVLLNLRRREVDLLVRSLRRKFSDWRPGRDDSVTNIERHEIVARSLAAAA